MFFLLLFDGISCVWLAQKRSDNHLSQVRRSDTEEDHTEVKERERGGAMKVPQGESRHTQRPIAELPLIKNCCKSALRIKHKHATNKKKTNIIIKLEEFTMSSFLKGYILAKFYSNLSHSVSS